MPYKGRIGRKNIIPHLLDCLFSYTEMVRYSHLLLSPSSKNSKEEEKDDGRAVALRMEAEKRDIKHYRDYGGKRLLAEKRGLLKELNFPSK